ncbi:MAP kinase-activated protein kinase 2 (Fragment) [Seminavis robusta]|uniref:MAP kinase-activated protein kinase 2 n=1 Tax=Seminavis robusta TaxID=568900 RepID=A0A9N8DVW6_9STRA
MSGIPDRFVNNDVVPHFAKNGTALTQEERAAIAKRKGLCVRCGMKTHAVSFFKTSPITNDHVHKGVCIKCNPTSVPAKVLQAYEDGHIPKPKIPTANEVVLDFCEYGRNGFDFGEIYGKNAEQFDSGNFGAVFVCQEKISKLRNAFRSTKKAVKITKPNALDTQKGPILTYNDVEKRCQEIHTLSILQRQPKHANILLLYQFFYEPTTQELHIVTELLGQNLRDWVEDQTSVTENQGKQVARAVLSAIQFIRSRKIVHRSIKEAEFCFKRPNAIDTLTLVDFGLAKVLEDGQFEKAFCGNTGYIAPEIYNHYPYRFEVDMFSFGVMMYKLLSGRRPWPVGPAEEVRGKTVNLEYTIIPEQWKGVSFDGLDFVRKLVAYREERMTTQEALDHKWLERLEAPEDLVPEEDGKPPVLYRGDSNFHVSINARNGHLFGDVYDRSVLCLDKGKFGTVFSCKHTGGAGISSKQSFAVKCTKPWDFDLTGPIVSYDDCEQRCEEIKSLVLLREEAQANHVLELIEFFYDIGTCELEIVTEKLGLNVRQLLDRRGGWFEEQHARAAALVMLRAIRFIHSHNIVHRDIEEANFVFGDSQGNDFESLRLVGFGQSKVLGKSDAATDYCGTLGYVAPEIYTREAYRMGVDLFSFGVLLYRILSGRLPWEAFDEDDYRVKTLSLEFNFNGDTWNNVSDNCKGFIHELLKLQDDRLDVARAFRHRWLASSALKAPPQVEQEPPERSKPPLPKNASAEKTAAKPVNRRFQRPDPPDTLTREDRGTSVELNTRITPSDPSMIAIDNPMPPETLIGQDWATSGELNSKDSFPDSSIPNDDLKRQFATDSQKAALRGATFDRDALPFDLTPEMMTEWKEMFGHLKSQLDPNRNISQYTPIPDQYNNNTQAKVYHRSFEDSFYTTVTVMRMQSQGLGLAGPGIVSEILRAPGKLGASFGGLLLPLVGEMLAFMVDRRNDVSCINKASCFLGCLPAGDGVYLDQFVTKLSAEMVHLHMARQSCAATNKRMLQMESGAMKVTLSTGQHSMVANLKAMVAGWWESAKSRARHFQLLEESVTDADVVVAMAHAGMVAQGLVEHSESIECIRNDQTSEQVASFLLQMMGIMKDDASPNTMPTAQGTGETGFFSDAPKTDTSTSAANLTTAGANTEEYVKPPPVDLHQLLEKVEGFEDLLEKVEGIEGKVEKLERQVDVSDDQNSNRVRQTLQQAQVLDVGVGVSSVPLDTGATTMMGSVDMAVDEQRFGLFGSDNVNHYTQADADRARISELEMENARKEKRIAAMEEQLSAMFDVMNQTNLDGTNKKKLGLAAKMNEKAKATQLAVANAFVGKKKAGKRNDGTASSTRIDEAKTKGKEHFETTRTNGEFVVSGPIKQPIEWLGVEVDDGQFHNDNEEDDDEDGDDASS